MFRMPELYAGVLLDVAVTILCNELMRAGEEKDAPEANRKARDEAWVRWKDLLKGL